jgi:hypothetical protein
MFKITTEFQSIEVNPGCGGEILFLRDTDLKILDQGGSYNAVLYSYLERKYSQFLSPTICFPCIVINVINIISMEISVKK